MDVKRLLVTTDFSTEARKAYPAAISWAKIFGARLHLVHAAEPFPVRAFFVGGFGAGMTASDYERELENRLREEVKEGFGAPGEGVEVEPFLLRGDSPIESLKSFCVEKEIDLVVTSTRGWTGLKHVVMGSFAEKLVRNLSLPVLTYKARDAAAAFEPRRVLVPFDFSENSRAVLPAIRMLAQSFLPEFKFVYVVETILDVWCAPDGAMIHSAVNEAARHAPRIVRDKFDTLKEEELAGINASLQVLEGQPAPEILRCADEWDCDLVLMATHGWTGFRHFMLGSVAEETTRKAPCTVLTVRGTHVPAREEFSRAP